MVVKRRRRKKELARKNFCTYPGHSTHKDTTRSKENPCGTTNNHNDNIDDNDSNNSKILLAIEVLRIDPVHMESEISIHHGLDN